MAITQTATQNTNFDSCAKKLQKTAVKHSIEKPILLYLVNMSSIFCPRLSEETNFKF